MSATPIPRTLKMALSGLRNLSIIETAPSNRYPVQTYVTSEDNYVVKDAIYKELSRDGQVYILYNNIAGLEGKASEIQKLVPDAKIRFAFGTMNKDELDIIMNDFTNHKFDILICTTIIENGIDIANANTLIVYDADHFGLSQLYQLRGRVGRSEKQAYCYCLYKKNKELTQEATERLKAIREFTTLGSGYRIAMRDVEIRGVGNILGTKQHGHMINVGFDTYCQLLEETVLELKGEHVENKKPTIVDINVTAYIPDEWVGSTEQKMIEYKRLADVNNEIELDSILTEWKDRFSRIPDEVENLVKLIKIRLIATECGISIIREAGDSIRIYTPFTQYEWNIIKQQVDKNLLRLIKFTIAPNSCTEGKSILLVNSKYLTFEELFNFLTSLFYDIRKIINTYNKN